MKMRPVSSSEIAALGYDPSKGLLRALFVEGGLYEYEQVPAKLYEQLLQAPSIGRFFNEHIRNANFAYRRLDG